MKKSLTTGISKILLMCLLITTIGPIYPALAADDLQATDDLQFMESKIHGEVNGEFPLNFTQVGDVDWLHLKAGEGNFIQIKKAGQSSVTFDVYGDNTTGTEGKLNKGSDTNYMSYSWTNGMKGYEASANDTGFTVFYPEKSRDPGSYENVGWNAEVAPQPKDSTIIFGVGMWEAEMDVKIYYDKDLQYSQPISARGPAKVFKYQFKVPANKKVTIEARQTKTFSGYGNMSFSGLAVSSQDIADRLELQNLYNEIKDITQGLYTDATWKPFADARDKAKSVLAQHLATQGIVDSALIELSTAQQNLEKKDTNIQIDFMGNISGGYTFGSKGDQQDRYQTFTPKESFEMEFVQVKVVKEHEPVSDLVVRLYETNEQGLPTGSELVKEKVRADQVISNEIITVPLTYSLQEGKRYAIVLTQETLGTGEYRWYIMRPNSESNSEFYGKSVSGNFQSEASLGTGLMRIIRKSNVDRSPLQELVNDIEQYNWKLFTVATWSQLDSVLKEAKERLSDLDAKQEDIDSAKDKLKNAFESLQPGSGLDKVAGIIGAISSVNLNGYMSESKDALEQAIQDAKNLGNTASDKDRIKAYSKVLNALDGLKPEGKYTYESHPKMTAAFGFEGDKNATIAFLDGSYQIGGTRPEKHGPVAPKQMVTFGVTDATDVKWYNAEGYLPVFIHEYSKDSMDYKIESFGNKHTVEGKDYVIDYSRMTVTNHSNETRLLPVVSKNLIPLNIAANQKYTIEPGETILRDYVIEADKYEYFDEGKTTFTSLTVEQVASQGDFDQNYTSMKSYWDDRLSKVVNIDLPNKELVNAFKAGYIYTMIIKDGNYLHVGENGYARLYSHDTIGILIQLIQSGDFTHAKDYLRSVPLTGGINIETR
ncbi:hypothetical protein RE628_05580 [Paenibacillus sp. D2_2]|uniref:hypothetical protein n=1 Tax=Paenibacillus sp. D2_2 TaxID=3073092 RepID=UPI00281601D9|nr:hypothetical protein [Paenibacillus sp. D2_2]WMT41914.1 hypothetical protein RE628_05580 [Paenibacillus sp. D2_2]